MSKRLLVVGGGPKAMAIAAKAWALSACGFSVPEIVIVEKTECAANWSGDHGYTDGQHSLGTPPEKDVGFPYFANFNSAVIQKMAENFSWNVFLITNPGVWMDFGEWVDRGRQHPPHWVWAKYFKWVGTKSGAQLIQGEVKRIGLAGQCWNVTYSVNGRDTHCDADGLVITGPGDPKKINGQPASSKIYDGKTFWKNLNQFNLPAIGLHDDPREICVIGSGETAASILVELIKRIHPTNHISLVNRQGMIFSRGENYFENTAFTYQDKFIAWQDLSVNNRDQIINQTDRGVFSLSSLKTINQAQNLGLFAGTVRNIALGSPSSKLVVTIVYEKDDRSPRSTLLYADHVILAIGFDALWFKELLDDSISPRWPDNLGFAHDLSLEWPALANAPKLHLPMLAGQAEGPGFPGLSCLGTLSDRILQSYVKTV